jgi:lysophospholipase L1-like esterase
VPYAQHLASFFPSSAVATLTAVVGNAGDGTIVATAVGQRVNMTGTSTTWLSAAPTFTVSSGSLGAVTVDSDTTAHATFTPSTTPGVVTFTDTLAGDTGTATLTTITQVTALATFTGPSAGVVSSPSTNFTVAYPASRANAAPVTITPASTLGGTFSPTSVTLPNNTNAPSATFTFTPTVTGAHSISLTNNGSLTNTGSPITYTVAAANPGQVGDTNLFWAPAAWRINGTSYAECNAAGNYVEFDFVDTSCAVIIDLSAWVADPSWAAGTRPQIAWSVDFGAFQKATLNAATLNGSNQCSLVLASGLANAEHDLRLWVWALNTTQNSGAQPDDRWTGPNVQSCRIAGFTKSDGVTAVGNTYTTQQGWLATTHAYRYLRNKTMAFFGDSITATEQTTYVNGVITAVNNSPFGWPYAIASMLQAEFANLAYGQTGWGSAGPLNIPAFYTVATDASSYWNKHYAGQSRLTGGKLKDSSGKIVDYVVACLGTNDFSSPDDGTIAPDAGIKARIQGWLTDCRAAVNTTTPIFLVVPFGGFGRSTINSAATAQADANVYVIDQAVTAEVSGVRVSQYGIQKTTADTSLGIGTPNFRSNESVHPTTQFTEEYIARIAPQIYNKVNGIGSGGGFRRITLNGGISG